MSPSPGCSASRTERAFFPPSSPRIIVVMSTAPPAPPAACSAPRGAARRRCRRPSHQGRRRFSGQTRGGRCYSWARYYHPTLQRFISVTRLVCLRSRCELKRSVRQRARTRGVHAPPHRRRSNGLLWHCAAPWPRIPRSRARGLSQRHLPAWLVNGLFGSGNFTNVYACALDMFSKIPFVY